MPSKWFLLLQTQSILVDMRLNFSKNRNLETNWLLSLIVINLFKDFNFRTAKNKFSKSLFKNVEAIRNRILYPAGYRTAWYKISARILGSLISKIWPDIGHPNIRSDTEQPDTRYPAGYRAAWYPISGRIQGTLISDIRPDTVLPDVRPPEYPSYIRDSTKAGYPFHP